MGLSVVQAAKRAFVKVILALALQYELALKVNRDSEDNEVLAAYRRLSKKVHPDKGGRTEDQQKLQAAKDAWEGAKKSTGTTGASSGGTAARSAPARAPEDEPTLKGDLAVHVPATSTYRVHSTGVLLTYHGVKNQAHWRELVAFFELHKREWSVKYWCATLETTKQGKLHAHVMLQFTKQVNHDTSRFFFTGLKPRADQHDLLGDGWCRKKLQESFDRAFFYCWAEKIGQVYEESGTACTTGNYQPAWVEACDCTYPVRWQWPKNLWKKYKLADDKYDTYLFLSKDGTEGQKRYLDYWRQRKAEEAEDKEMAAVVKRIRTNFLKPFPNLPEADAWLANFKQELDRFPFLLFLGPSRSGKTEWAKSLFESPLELKIGTLENFPEAMRRFSRQDNDALILDDVRDAYFFVRHQEKLQGKYDAKIEFATTPGGQCSYTKWLWRVLVVATANYTTTNLNLLESDDFLGNPLNRVVVKIQGPSVNPDQLACAH